MIIKTKNLLLTYYGWRGFLNSLIGGGIVSIIAIFQHSVLFNISFSEIKYSFLFIPFAVGFTVGTLIHLLVQSILMEQTSKKDLEVLYANLDERLNESLQKWRDTEKQLFHAQRMESIGQLASGIAHEFNNILSIINFSMELIQHESESAKVKYLSDKIFAAIERASSLIHRMMMFSRKSQSSEMMEANLREAVESAVKLVLVTVPSHIQLSLSTDVNAEYLIRGNKFEIEQVILNMVNNAIHAIGDKEGKIHISMGNVKNSEGEQVYIFIEDNGKGMPASVQAHIFDPFFTTKDVGEGTGLGLSVAHGIINNHAGRVEVSSQESKGTVFKMYFPKISDGPKAKTAQVSVPKSKNKELVNYRVLIVDDEPSVADLAKSLLESRGYQVHVCYDVDEAIEIFSNENFEIVISDFKMPGLTGLELLDQMKKIRADMRGLIMTGLNAVFKKEDLLKLGVSQVIAKPFCTSDLDQAIRQAVGHNSQKQRNKSKLM